MYHSVQAGVKAANIKIFKGFTTKNKWQRTGKLVRFILTSHLYYPKNSIFAPLLRLIMEYREIVAVTGLSGLYQLVTTKSDGAIVRSVADKSTKFISARQHNVTPLDSIEVYTTGDNVRLQVVFSKMQEHEATIPLADAKSPDTNVIKKYFKSIFPEFDEERVYVSDMKKMLKWYDLLKANDLLHFEEEAAEETTEEVPVAENAAPSEVAETTPVNEVKAPDTIETATTEVAEKPKKAAKKKKAEGEEVAQSEVKPAKKAAKKKETPNS